MAYMPEGSGLYHEEVDRGICVTHIRSEYLSIHLKGGAPAFSPNNMRVGVLGMKKVTSKQGPGKQNKKESKKQKNKKEEEAEKEED